MSLRPKSKKVEEATERVWQQHTDEKFSDLTRVEFQYAVFSHDDCEILKLEGLDLRAMRFDVSGERATRWLHFSKAVMFNFCNPDEFEKYYMLYYAKHPRGKNSKKMFDWLAMSRERISRIPDKKDE